MTCGSRMGKVKGADGEAGCRCAYMESSIWCLASPVLLVRGCRSSQCADIKPLAAVDCIFASHPEVLAVQQAVYEADSQFNWLQAMITELSRASPLCPRQTAFLVDQSLQHCRHHLLETTLNFLSSLAGNHECGLSCQHTMPLPLLTLPSRTAAVLACRCFAAGFAPSSGAVLDA